MKKATIIVALIILLILCAGCESNTFFPLKIEIDDVTIVRIFAIDQGIENTDDFRVTVVMQSGSEPTSDGEGEKNNNTVILSCEAKTISSATRALQEYVNKKLFYGHIDICLIGEQVANKDIYGVMDFLTRDPEFRLNSYMFITNGNAVDLLVACDAEVYYLPERIKNIADNMSLLSFNYLLKVQKLNSMLDDNGFSAIAMPVLAAGIKYDDEKHALMTAPEIEIASYAVVKGGRLVGYVEKESMIGYNIISNKIKFPIIDIDTDSGSCIALEVVQGETTITPVTESGVLKGIVIHAKIHANINEMKHADVPINEETIHELEEKLEVTLSEHVNKCIETAKELNADFIGINSALLHKRPYIWQSMENEYNDLFPELTITFELSTNIDRTYDTRDSIGGKK